MTLNDLLNRLQGVKRTGENQYAARCPNSNRHKHNDSTPSLSVSSDTKTGKILLCCQTGCSIEEICSAIGCSVSDLMGNGNHNRDVISFCCWCADQQGLKLIDIYDYRDGLYKARFIDSNGKKTFRWIHEDSAEKSGFKMNRQNVRPRLYVSGSLDDSDIFIAEGEKDADTLHRITGRAAACSENGAGKQSGKKWADEYNQQIKGKRVFLLWDNDDVGKEFAQMEIEQMKSHASQIIPIDIVSFWPECPEKGDISDAVEKLGEDEVKNRLRSVISNTQPILCGNDKGSDDTSSIIVHNAVQITPEKSSVPDLITYDAEYFNNTEIIPPVPIIDKILYPGLGMLGSPAKMGKSYMMLQLAVCIATGEPFMNFAIIRPGRVLYMDLQGTPARTKKRLHDIGFYKMPKDLTVTYKARATDSGLVEQLEKWISSCEKRPSLIIIDMLQQVKGSQRKTEDSYAADNRILEPLHDLALKNDLSVLCVMHTRKGSKILPDDDPFNEIIGSIAQFGTADCAWMIIGRRTDDRKRFSVICRDNDSGQMDFEATFRNYKWNIAGTVEECEEEREVSRYNQNPIVFTFRKLIEEAPSGWNGTMTEIINEVYKRTNQYPASTPEKMQRMIKDIEYRLSCENIWITCLDPHGGKRGRRYRIYRQDPEQMQI